MVKCLIRFKSPGLALRVTQFFKENCLSDKGENNIIEVPESSYKEDHEDILNGLKKVKSMILYDINTFFLNG